MERSFIELGTRIYKAPPTYVGKTVDYHGTRRPVIYDLSKMLEYMNENGQADLAKIITDKGALKFSPSNH